MYGEVNDHGTLRLSSDMLGNVDYGTLSDRLYRRYIECALLASRCSPIGWLPQLGVAAWYIHVDEVELYDDLVELWKEGVVRRYAEDGGEYWYIPGVEPTSRTQREIVRYEFARQRRARYRELVERDGEYCQHCGTTHTLSVDHILAVANGGRNELENMQLLCRSCNSRKGAR